MQEFNQENAQPSYQNSVLISGIIFGLAVFVISLTASYTTIYSEPTGFIFSPVQLIGTLGCLVGSFGGMFAIWHYTRSYDVPLTLGKGALIGFLAGIAILIINILLNEFWTFIDPDLNQKLLESSIANIKAMDFPKQQKRQMMDMMASSMKGERDIISKLLWGLPFYGILNLITAMIGVKLFGKKEI